MLPEAQTPSRRYAAEATTSLTQGDRLEQMFARLGVPIARSTINDLFRRAGQKLEPLRAPLFEAIKADFVVHADETSFTMTKQTSKAFIWTFVGQSLTGYRFDLTRGGSVPLDVLGESTGVVLCDDYRGQNECDTIHARCTELSHGVLFFLGGNERAAAMRRDGFGVCRHHASLRRLQHVQVRRGAIARRPLSSCSCRFGGVCRVAGRQHFKQDLPARL